MKISIKAFTITVAIFWGGAFFLILIANAISPDYGKPFLEMMDSLYPGYKFERTFFEIVVGTLYALLDGAIAGLVFGWLYNTFSKSE